MRDELIAALKTHQPAFGIELGDAAMGRLADYYELVMEHNPILHLVGPCTAEDFATRHILESLTLLPHLPDRAKFADIGPGAGLPSIPCLLVREDLRAMLVESKEKKTSFLTEAVTSLGIAARADIVTKQFQEATPGDCEYVVCRALDKFVDRLPKLAKWGMRRPMLLFSGPALRDLMNEKGFRFTESLMPLSEQRYLFVVQRNSASSE